MINRYFYKSSISDFLDTPVDTIFGQMSRADEMDSAATQKYAWEQEIEIMSMAEKQDNSIINNIKS